MVGVTIHLDESLNHDRRMAIADLVRAHGGVSAVAQHDERPHLMIVEYDPAAVTAQALLTVVRAQGVHAELVGL